MELETFFEELIEGYLFTDLAQMATLDPLENGMGAAGYPMVGTIISGMSLLGGLSMGDYAGSSGEPQFKRYWDRYLGPFGGLYSQVNADIVHRLARNGIAHTSLAGVGITVTKDRQNHLERHRDGFNIDALQFMDDFKQSYDTVYKPQLTNAESFRALVQANIYRYLEVSARTAQHALRSAGGTTGQTEPAKPVTTPSGTRLSGASGPAGPIPTSDQFAGSNFGNLPDASLSAVPPPPDVRERG